MYAHMKYLEEPRAQIKYSVIAVVTTDAEISSFPISPGTQSTPVAKILSWPKSLFVFSYKMLWKNPNELFGQPNR